MKPNSAWYAIRNEWISGHAQRAELDKKVFIATLDLRLYQIMFFITLT